MPFFRIASSKELLAIIMADLMAVVAVTASIKSPQIARQESGEDERYLNSRGYAIFIRCVSSPSIIPK